GPTAPGAGPGRDVGDASRDPADERPLLSTAGVLPVRHRWPWPGAAPLTSVLVVLTTIAALEMLRISGPVLDGVAVRHGVPWAALTAVVTFGAAALAGPLTWWVGSREAVLLSVCGLAVLRLVVQFPAARGLLTVSAAVAAALIALLMVLRAALGTQDGPAWVARAVALGVAIDLAVRLPLDLWDPVWRGGPIGWSVALLLALALAGAAWARYRENASVPMPVTAQLAVAGPVLALLGVFLASPAFLASQGGMSQASAGMWIAGGVLLGIAGLSLPPLPVAGPVAAVALPVAVLGLLVSPAPLAGPLTLLALALLPPLLTRAVTLREETRRRTALLGMTLAGLGCGLGYVAVVLPYQAHYEMPMPVPNLLFPVLGAAVIGWAAWTASPPARPARAVAPLLTAGVLFALPPLSGAVSPAPHPLPTDTADGSYRLLSWNVHYAVDRDAELVPEQILSVVRDSGAHVVVLQEVPRGWPIAGGTDLLAWLENRLDVTAVWAPAADRQFGNVILTSLPVTESYARSLPQGGGTMGRSYAVAEIELADGLTTRVATTHLQHDDARETRLAQLGMLLADHRDDPFSVLTGDFNAEPGSTEIDTVLDAGFRSAQDEAGDPEVFTAPTHDPAHRIDWVFGSEGADFEEFDVLDSNASDHAPLTVTVLQR
ncbi:endonuclease/exonuclease/phosphatase family protein, partial [Streptomyces spiramenti]|uniref:endonuclease/exonuclease/phosphatase family protein n=1 Tax=Streptomyces spiramenti TaxID=2720606 RepID=UPI001ADDDE6F